MPVVSPQEGPVAVTGASGYIGAHTVRALMRHGFDVHACVTDRSKPEKVDHLNALNLEGLAGSISIYQANILEQGSYDEAFADCTAVLHVGTPMGYGRVNSPREVYDGMMDGIKNVLASGQKSGTLKRFVYTSSFAAIGHPAPSGYVYSEEDWGDQSRDRDRNWSLESIDSNGEVAYAMAKVGTEHQVNKLAKQDGRFDAVSICPCVVLGPLLSVVHECLGSWQYFLARMLEDKPCMRGWQALWNIVDVRDVAEAEALVIMSENVKDGSRYQLTATDPRGEINVHQLQTHLQNLFPNISIGGTPPEYDEFIQRRGSIHNGPRAYSRKAIVELGLQTHVIEDTLRETGQTMIDLGLCEPAYKRPAASA